MKNNDIIEILLSIVAGIAAGGVFLFLFLTLHWNILFSAVLAIGCFAGMSYIIQPIRRIGTIRIESMPNGAELSRRLNEAEEDFKKIEKAVQKIHDLNVRNLAQELQRTASDILVYLETHPEKITLARQFIDYYQETAASLLLKYVELQDTCLDTDEVRKLKADTAHALTVLKGAFEQQFQKLMRNEMLDMDAEIRLLKKTVEMESGSK